MAGGVELIHGSASRTPNHAWISACLRAARNPKNPLNTDTYPRRVLADSPALANAPTTRSRSSRVTSQAGRPHNSRMRSRIPVALSTVAGLKFRATWLAAQASMQAA
jgi:hypothetical protein